MPNTKTAKKALRQNVARRAVNRPIYTRLSNLYNGARKMLQSSSDMESVRGAIVEFESYGMKTNRSGTDKKSISSKVSRLVHSFKKKFHLYSA